MQRTGSVFSNRNTFELIWKAIVGLALWVLLMAALALNAHAQQEFNQPTRNSVINSPEAIKPETGSETRKAEQPTAAAKTEPSQSGAEMNSTIEDAAPQATPSQPAQTASSESKWHYGGFFDVGYLLDFNHPENRVFRSRGTTWHVDRPKINMAAFCVRKKATEDSRWGVELTAQAGKDAELFGFSATAPNIAGYKFLRQLGPTNVSYLAPIGKGLTIQGGTFSSFIGYDSLYAKDNFNYTRPWGADFTPYYMLGVNASYPFTKKVTGSFFVVNGYWHLANANSVPSWGGQAAVSATSHLTVRQTVLVGPHQSNTAFRFWRFLSDTIIEHKTEKRTIAFDTNFSTEAVNSSGAPRAWWFAAQAPVRWILNPRWGFAVRPEVAWDSQGRWTLAKQTVVALTTTVEYKLPFKSSNTIFRLEHRYDRSTGPEGGFFRGRVVSPGVIGLTPGQHLLIFATIFTFDR
ncbi:MAG TPA: outer membrane beta-barrel protein [Pyrinomonadaceae bacterium]|nr:outer membrane beta-barrel protein [Pyrinomonadaceae bacterium]